MNIGTLTIEMAANVARLRSDMDQAKGLVNSGMNSIKSMASMASKALAGIGTVLAARELAQWVQQAIDAADATSKMAQKIGLAVPQIAGLEMAFRQSDLSAEDMQKSMGKLSQKIAEGADVFKAMGLSTKAADGSLKSTRDMLGEVADKFASYRDGTEKSALALEVFSKAGLAMIPLLNGGADGLAEYDKKAKELGLTLETDTAKAAEQFNDTLDAVGLRITGVSNQVAARMLPALVDMSNQLLMTVTSTDNLKKSTDAVSMAMDVFLEVGRTAFEAVAVLGLNVKYVISQVGNEVGGLIAQTTQLLQLNFEGAATIRDSMIADGARARADIDATTASILSARRLVEIAKSGIGQDERRFMSPEQVPGMNLAALKAVAPVMQVKKALSDAAKDIEKLSDKVIKLRDKILGESAAVDPSFYANIRMLNDAADKGLLTDQERLDLAEKYIKQQKFYTQQLKAEEETRKANIEIIAKENDLLNKQDEEKRNNVISMFDTVEAMEFETSTLFMTNEQRKLSIFLRDMENKGIKEGSDEYKILAERMAGAIKSESFLVKWKDISTKIGDTLTDAIMEGGANAADMLRDMFKSLVLRPVVSAIVGSLGLGGAGGAMAAGAGGVGEALGLQSTISTLSNLYSTATGSFAKIATSVGGMAADVGVWMAEMGTTTTEVAGTIMADSSSLMATAGEGLIDASGSIGSAASSLAGLYAGYAIGNAISGNKSIVNDNPGYTTATGAAAGALAGTYVFPVIGTAIGAVIGGVLGGVANLAFGTGEKVARDSGLTGKFTSQGAQMQNFQKWDQEGGWFRSDKSGTDLSALGSDLQELLDVALKATASTVKGYVELLGLNSDAIAGFSQDLAFNLNGMTDEEAQQRIALAISNFGNFMIESLFKEVDHLRKRGETAGEALLRLSSSLKSVNSVFTVLNLKLMETSVAGADASSKLIDTFGGIESFVKATDFYYQNFYTETERTNNTITQLTSAFKALGLELPDTKDAFKAMVTAARDASNADLFAALLALAPTFDSIQKATESANDSLQQRLALEQEWLTLTGDSTAIAKLARAEISENNLALYDRITVLKEERLAIERAAVVAEERLALEDRLAEGANDVLRSRERELASVDESNRALLLRVHALENERSSLAASQMVLDIFTKAIEENITTTAAATDSAYQGLEKSISKQKQAIDIQAKAAQESISNIQGIFNLLKGEVEGLYQAAGAGMSRAAANEFLKQAIATAKTTGYLPDQEQLGKVIGAAKSGMEPESYSSAFELRRDRMLLANQLAELQTQAGNQLNTAELQLVAAQDQLLRLDAQLEAARLQIEVMRGINSAVLSVGAATAALANAMLSESTARSLTPSGMISSSASNTSGGSPYGLPSQMYDAFISAGNITVEQARSYFPAFASGGSYDGGMALVGEEGPELINFKNPGMVYTAAQSANLMGGSDEMVTELRALRSEVSELRYEARATAVATTKQAKLADRWTNEGLTVRTDSDSPLDTVVV